MGSSILEKLQDLVLGSILLPLIPYKIQRNTKTHTEPSAYLGKFVQNVGCENSPDRLNQQVIICKIMVS